MLKEKKSDKDIFTSKILVVTLTLGLTPQGLQEPPGGWKVKSSTNLECVRMLASSPSTSTTSLTCEKYINIYLIYSACAEDIKQVELLLYSRINTP